MSNFRPFIILPLSAGLLLVVLAGCNRSPAGITSVADYRVEGVLVQEMNHDDAHAVARLWRDDSTLISSTLRLADTPMPYFASHLIDSAYQTVIRPAVAHAGDQVYFHVVDSFRFADSVLINVVDTFSITDNFEPPNRLLPGGGQVSLEWTSAANAEGYIIATVKVANAYTGVGYSAQVGTGLNAGTIPASAFVDPVTSELDTGLYYVYVYAFSGSPDSTQASHWLPTHLSQEFPLNIDKSDFSGRFGTLAVTLHDSVQVTSGR